MQFSQYWIVLITVILVIISIFNISKMIVFISKSKENKIKNNEELNKNLRNLLLSVGLLSIESLVYIILVFKQM